MLCGSGGSACAAGAAESPAARAASSAIHRPVLVPLPATVASSRLHVSSADPTPRWAALPARGLPGLVEPDVEEVRQVLARVALGEGDEAGDRAVAAPVGRHPVAQDREEGGVAEALAQRLQRRRTAHVDAAREQLAGA